MTSATWSKFCQLTNLARFHLNFDISHGRCRVDRRVGDQDACVVRRQLWVDPEKQHVDGQLLKLSMEISPAYAIERKLFSAI